MPDCHVYTFAEMEVGKKVTFPVTLSEDLVARFSEVSGDYNPLHMDEAYATETQFGKRIVHGQLGVSLLSQLIGMYLPGKYALYLNQRSTFRAPMFVGAEVVVVGEVKHKNEAMQTLVITTEVRSQDLSVVHIDGEALVKMLK
jgi:3-hydroxybutyryl-CoA dehydratase